MVGSYIVYWSLLLNAAELYKTDFSPAEFENFLSLFDCQHFGKTKNISKWGSHGIPRSGLCYNFK